MEEYQKIFYNKLIITLMVITFGVIGIVKIIQILPSRMNEHDFAHYYATSRALIERQNVYQINFHSTFEKYGFISSKRVIHPTNPPLLIWFFAVFAWMTPVYSFWSWIIFLVFCCFTILWLMKKLLADYPSKTIWPLGSAFFLISSGLYFNFLFSQVQLLLLALILGAYLFHKNQNPKSAILLVVFAGMIKLYPLVFLPWFIARSSPVSHSRILYAIFSFFLISFFILISGPSLWLNFIYYGMPMIRDVAINAKGNYSIPSFVINIFYVIYNFDPPIFMEKIIITIGGISGAVFLLFIYTIIFKLDVKQDVEFSLLSIGSIICGITCWPFYLVFLLFPFSVAFCELDFNTSFKRILFMTLLTILVTAGIEIDLLLETEFNISHLMWYYLPSVAMLTLATMFFNNIFHRNTLE